MKRRSHTEASALWLVLALCFSGLSGVHSSRADEIIVTPATQDIWTTSVFSFGPTGGGPGGGLADQNLKVGGWGDSYYSLIQFNLAGLPRSATNVELRLYNQQGPSGSAPTGLNVSQITQYWNWQTQGTGADRDRLWWADRPATVPVSLNLPAPAVDSFYSVNITSLYNSWQSGTTQNYGVQLSPTSINNNFDYFLSSRASDASLRPALVIETTPQVSHSTFVDDFHSLSSLYVSPEALTSPIEALKSQNDQLALMNGALSISQNLGTAPQSLIENIGWDQVLKELLMLKGWISVLKGTLLSDPLFYVICPQPAFGCYLPGSDTNGTIAAISVSNDHLITGSLYRVFNFDLSATISPEKLGLFSLGTLM